ncbi:chromosome partitioning protein ParB [Trinickia dabaoshanensis]|uniref:Chromosome partitioning protein ParB n=1 Tax=Trinickia dabaoshanensis TaxID=564714 RepID=A0A2N7VEL6_9BURK|nr:ParB N-terminal domain-containing protein [Trinickia dabaoshanensis]PMS15598.1 chromosome partitioning protein ParB [Trinickia dabaoshanensis]
MHTVDEQNVERATIQYVPYSRLAPSPYNVRKRAPTGIEALAETIAEKGVLQNLVVHEIKGRAKEPKLGVCAGQRREAALDLLFEKGRIPKDYPVPVLVVSEGEAVAASLIENREREDMHIADECMAFRLLVDEGKSVAHIAAMFKVPDVAVRRALKIANLAPSLLDLLREDKLDYEQAKALALADDHTTQERVWAEAREGWQRRPAQLQAALTKAEIDARESALAKFVGLDAYEKAGGYVRRDLFSDDPNAGFIEDADLLHRLATDRLIELSQTVAVEGWAWTECRTKYDAVEIMRHGHIQSHTRKPKKTEKAELAELTAKRDAAQAELDAYYDEEGEPDEARCERLEAAATAATLALDQYTERFESFDADDMKKAGAFIYIDKDGQVCVERGLVRRERAPTHSDSAAYAINATGGGTRSKEKPLHGEKLCKRLTAHRTAAVQIELAQQPTVALAVLMYRMIPAVFRDVYERTYYDHAVKIEVQTTRDALLSNADDMAESVAWKALEDEREKWAQLLPKRVDELLAWLLRQEQGVMSNLFAFCVAATVNGISAADHPHAINEIANTLAVDYARYWKPTRAAYFEHVPKSRIEVVVGEAVSPQSVAELRGMKKADAAAAAELRMADSGWLPEVLRNREVPKQVAYGYWENDDDESDDDAVVDADAMSEPPDGGEQHEAEAA